MNKPELQVVIGRLAQVMARQREALQSSDYDGLESVLPECEAALEGVMSYPGGVEVLRRDMDQLPPSDREALYATLELASREHRIGRELIAVAIQRSAALQGFHMSQSDSATYSDQGSVSHATGSLLSRKV